MDNASLFSQIRVYFNKTRRIAIQEKFWKYFIFSFVIALLVSDVVGEKMFKTYEGTRSGFFAIASAAIWIGLFNSIQNICREHNIIRSEYRSGMKITAYITANLLWQLIICLLQSIIIIGVSMFFVDYNKNGVLLSSALLEYCITVFLLTFTADIIGIMISSIAGDPAIAMTIMPFVLILQLIMSGVLFELKGLNDKISYITLSKWGMNALGTTADLNSEDYPYELSEVFPNVVRIEVEECYDHTTENLLINWSWCAGIGTVCYVASIFSLKIRNRDS